MPAEAGVDLMGRSQKLEPAGGVARDVESPGRPSALESENPRGAIDPRSPGGPLECRREASYGCASLFSLAIIRMIGRGEVRVSGLMVHVAVAVGSAVIS